MELINGTVQYKKADRRLYLALGNFDGVHRAHQLILKKTVEKAKSVNGISAAMIFDPHPVTALQPTNKICLLTDIADRAELMAGLELDLLFVEQFTKDFSMLTADQFINEILVERLSIREVFVGADFRFGYGGSGNADHLSLTGRQLGFKTNTMPILYDNSDQISSSTIRSLLLAGSVRKAAELLGYYLFRQGRVIRGRGRGKKLVYPTANITASPNLLWPAEGVYFTAVGNVRSETLFGVTNVGSRPTFSDHELTVETHLIDFDSIIYNHEIRIYFIEKLRDTINFSSPEQLKAQVGKDIDRCRKLMKDFNVLPFGQSNSLQPGCSVLRS